MGGATQWTGGFYYFCFFPKRFLRAFYRRCCRVERVVLLYLVPPLSAGHVPAVWGAGHWQGALQPLLGPSGRVAAVGSRVLCRLSSPRSRGEQRAHRCGASVSARRGPVLRGAAASACPGTPRDAAVWTQTSAVKGVLRVPGFPACPARAGVCTALPLTVCTGRRRVRGARPRTGLISGCAVAQASCSSRCLR